jgi:thiamine biosynthesis lipoprotein
MALALALAAMATRFELVLEDGARAAGELALEEVAEVERRLSRFRRDSLTSALLADAAQADSRDARRGVVATRDEVALFELCRRACARSNGAFDPAFHAPSAISRRSSPFSAWSIDRRARRVVAPRGAERLDFGAIGKGHALDRAVRVLRGNGVASALLHGGTSSVAAIGARHGGAPWKVAIRDPLDLSSSSPSRPLAVVELRDASLSVSAPHGRPGHVVDPRDGTPVERTKLAAVVTRHGAVAEIASTALLVLVERRLRAGAPVDLEELRVRGELLLPRPASALVAFERDGERHVHAIGSHFSVVSSASPRAAISTLECVA